MKSNKIIEKFTPKIQRRLLNVGAFHTFKEWRNWRKLQKSRIKAQPYCSICRWKKKLQVHHILPRHLFPLLALVAGNTIVLCAHCHFHFGHFNNFKNFNMFILDWIKAINKIRFSIKEKEKEIFTGSEIKEEEE